MTNIIQELQDPLNFIPDESFCSILSFLSPISIAIASAVCKKWRKFIRFDSVNHRYIDLGRLDQHSEAEDVIDHLDRLSSLALDKVVTLGLNLSCFYKGFSGFQEPLQSGIRPNEIGEDSQRDCHPGFKRAKSRNENAVRPRLFSVTSRQAFQVF